MGPVEELLSSYRTDVERQIKSGLKGVLGPFLKGYLPQVWVFETESEVVSFVIDAGGKAIVEGREWRPRDVTIRWKGALLVSVLKSRSRQEVPEGEKPETVCHTPKGCAALNLLKSRLGI